MGGLSEADDAKRGSPGIGVASHRNALRAKKFSPSFLVSASDGGGTVARDRALKGTARGAIVTRYLGST